VKQKEDPNKPIQRVKNKKLMQLNNKPNAGQDITDRMLKVLHRTSQTHGQFIERKTFFLPT